VSTGLWLVHQTDVHAVHVMPHADLVEHEFADGCVCGPRIMPVPTSCGAIGWNTVHHSLDGREKTQPTTPGQ
jgi:hypothetical protein